MSEARIFFHVQGLTDLWMLVLDECYVVVVEYMFEDEMRESFSYVMHSSLESARMEVAQIQEDSINDYEAGQIPLEDIVNIEIRGLQS